MEDERPLDISRRAAAAVVALLLLIILGLVFINDCSYIGGMGSSAETCECSGFERVLYDQTEGDGPMRSICIGRVADRTCFQYLDGPEVPCSP